MLAAIGARILESHAHAAVDGKNDTGDKLGGGYRHGSDAARQARVTS
jgi:hypothetical protein